VSASDIRTAPATVKRRSPKKWCGSLFLAIFQKFGPPRPLLGGTVALDELGHVAVLVAEAFGIGRAQADGKA
jgi:hypothetical protein